MATMLAPDPGVNTYESTRTLVYCVLDAASGILFSGTYEDVCRLVYKFCLARGFHTLDRFQDFSGAADHWLSLRRPMAHTHTARNVLRNLNCAGGADGACALERDKIQLGQQRLLDVLMYAERTARLQSPDTYLRYRACLMSCVDSVAHIQLQAVASVAEALV